MPRPISNFQFPISKLLTRGVAEVIDRAHLEARIKRGEKLRVKLGIDPTGAELHLGHAVVLRKLRQFQDAGHQVVLIIGDFTAQIGDPSGRSEDRKVLTNREIKANEKTYLAQAGKILDIKKTEVRHNSEWLRKGGLALILQLAKLETLARAHDREDFKKRMATSGDVTMLEALYSMFQGYDSVAIKADLELGGIDQRLNLLAGRKVQDAFGQPAQDIMTLQYLLGTDGKRKMSKSYGNTIPLTAESNDMFGKLMRVPDEQVATYAELLTDLDIDDVKNGMKKSPRATKADAAHAIVAWLHGKKPADVARVAFDRQFHSGERPEKIPTFSLTKTKDKTIVSMLVASGLVPSKSEARRLLVQNGVRVNGRVITDLNQTLSRGDILQLGKRRFLQLS